MSNPVAVIISDVHYNVQTLPLADAAMRQAIAKANELDVPLIVAGDLHDTKANMRAECVNAMIETFSLCRTLCYILRGNHDQIHEKSTEHALNFLDGLGEMPDLEASGYDRDEITQPAVTVIDSPKFINDFGFNMMSPHLIPYHSDPEELKKYLTKIDKGSLVIMHQGCQGSNMGDYVQDHSALPRECFADFRVISGHYHTRQHIKCGKPGKNAAGLLSYIGNPYTLGFGEANDPEKGFQILMDDGTLEFTPTNLRKHVIIEMDGTKGVPYDYNPGDLLWVKLTAKKEDLPLYTREVVGKMLNIHGEPFKLDLIPISTEVNNTANSNTLQQDELLDNLIDSLTNSSEELKARLKNLWKSLV